MLTMLSDAVQTDGGWRARVTDAFRRSRGPFFASATPSAGWVSEPAAEQVILWWLAETIPIGMRVDLTSTDLVSFDLARFDRLRESRDDDLRRARELPDAEIAAQEEDRCRRARAACDERVRFDASRASFEAALARMPLGSRALQIVRARMLDAIRLLDELYLRGGGDPTPRPVDEVRARMVAEVEEAAYSAAEEEARVLGQLDGVREELASIIADLGLR